MRLIKILLAIFIILAITEILLKIFWNPPYLDPTYKRDDIGWAMKNVSLNTFGYRDKEISLLKDKDTYRIYFLGDSFEYGWYINDPSKSLPKLLEKDLNEKFGKKVEVINAARNGFGFDDKLNRLGSHGLIFNPDVFIIGFNLDDFVEKGYPPKFINNKFIQSLKLYQITFGNLERERVRKLTEEEVKKSYEDEKNLEKIKNKMETFTTLAKSGGAVPMVVFFPLYNPRAQNGEYPYKNYHVKLMEIATELGIHAFDLEAKYYEVSDKSRLFLNPNDWHPSVYANEVASIYMLDSYDWNKNIFSKSPLFSKELKKKFIAGDLLKLPFRPTGLPDGWVYFDDNSTDAIMILKSKTDREINYIEDKLLTNKEGNAVLEHHIPVSDSLKVKKSLYGFRVVAIKGVTGYWRVGGGLRSLDIDTNNYNTNTEADIIKITIDSKVPFEYFKISLELETKQFNLIKGKIEKISDENGVEIKYLDD